MVIPSTTGVALPFDLDAAKVEGLPGSAYYISNFISIEEEQLILEKVRDPENWQNKTRIIAAAPKPRWKQLTHRRLQTWPSDLVRDKLLDAQLPAWLESPIVSRIQSIPIALDDETTHIFSASPHQRPNHVLINEYPPGVGIMPHKASLKGDGAAYWPVVCTVSLGGSLCLDLYRSKEDGALDPAPAWRILQEPRSLLITTDQLYTDYLHGIADIKEDVNLSADTIANWSLLQDPSTVEEGRIIRQTRTSLTYRDVLKVSKAASKIGMFLKR